VTGVNENKIEKACLSVMKGSVFQPMFTITNAITAAAVCCLFTACAAIRTTEQVFTPLDGKAAREAFAHISAATGGWETAKCKLHLSVVTHEDGDNETYSARAVCLWQPGKAVRVRVYYLMGAVADLLYDGKRWYLTDEQNGRVYICRRIDGVRMTNVPDEFFTQMQRLPGSWLPVFRPEMAVAAGESAYRIEETGDWGKRVLIFPFGSALPSELRIETRDGSALTATFAKPDTNITANAAMFKPMLEGYEAVDI